jgi:ABC-type branched-subunit amino acid transport system ATPase component
MCTVEAPIHINIKQAIFAGPEHDNQFGTMTVETNLKAFQESGLFGSSPHQKNQQDWGL